MSTSSLPPGRAMRGWLAGVVLAFLALGAGSANAKEIRVFALGASNTNGKGVGTTRAWPAVLERMLRAKGYDANVTVSAVNGDTSEDVLRRASGIPAGTQVVVFDTGGDNDHLHGRSDGQIQATRAKIVAAIRAHHAVPIQAPYKRLIGAMRSGGAGYQPDGHHLTAASHERIAAYLASKVIAAAK